MHAVANIMGVATVIGGVLGDGAFPDNVEVYINGEWEENLSEKRSMASPRYKMNSATIPVELLPLRNCGNNEAAKRNQRIKRYDAYSSLFRTEKVERRQFAKGDWFKVSLSKLNLLPRF